MNDPDFAGLFHELAPLHTHHEPCGEPVLFALHRQGFTSLCDGSEHVCSTVDTEECDCGEPLLLSRFGRLRERDTGKAHLCPLDVDRMELDAAADRGAWSTESKWGTGWRIPLRKGGTVGRSFLP